MRTFRTLVVAPLVLILGLSGSGFAQERHLVDPSAIAGAVADHVTQQDSRRAAIQATLARPEVEQLAGSIGVDLAQVRAGVNTLNDESLSRVSAAANDVDQALVGGASTITISTTTIIIVLLLVILILVID